MPPTVQEKKNVNICGVCAGEKKVYLFTPLVRTAAAADEHSWVRFEETALRPKFPVYIIVHSLAFIPRECEQIK